MERVVALLEAGERGEMAELQLAYRMAEKRNAVLRSLIGRRSAPLLKFSWDVKVAAILPPGATEAMANAQKATLRAWYDRVDNLNEAIEFLALAEFRGYSHLQIQTEAGTAAGIEAVAKDRICLKPIHQWHWVRNGSGGRWAWNEAATGIGWNAISEAHRVKDPAAWGLIIREVDMPIDELALIGFVRKSMAQKDWDAWVEIYGIPGGVVTMPPNVPDGMEREYENAALSVSEGGSGALPSGSRYTPNTAARDTNPFRDHIHYQDSELVLAGTGGKLTMLAESGSGTLAGGAHQKAFDEIAAGEAGEISEVMQRHFDRHILDLVHPGEPCCAYWELRSKQSGEDQDAFVGRVCRLAGVGYRTNIRQVSEKTGLTLQAVPVPPPVVQPSPGGFPAPSSLANRRPKAPVKNSATRKAAPKDPLASLEFMAGPTVEIIAATPPAEG